ncbi:MAG: polysaccharide lyase [Pseudonocardia sp.]
MGRPSTYAVRAVGLAAVVGLIAACGSEPPPRSDDIRSVPSVPGSPGLLWVGDLETGDLSQFDDTPWNIARGGVPAEVVSDPQFVREGRYALKLSIPGPASDEGTCCDPRAEVEPAIPDIRAGDELFFSFSTKLADDFPVDRAWQVITQWKARADGSPPLSLNVEKGQYMLQGGAGLSDDGPEPFKTEIGPAVTGEWVDWMVHIKFSPDPEEGFVEVWQGDTKVLPRFQPDTGTMYPAEESGEKAESYLKVGYYRESDIDQAGAIYFDSWKVGTTREAVA